MMGPARGGGVGAVEGSRESGPEKSSPYRPCAEPCDSFARDRGISPQPVKHESHREQLIQFFWDAISE